MKKYFAYSLPVLASLILSPSVFAAGYGDAGCGLGALVFGNNPNKYAQVLAWTTNGTSSSQPIGITLDASNCDAKDGIVLAQKEQEVFVFQNFDTLTREMAAGEGEQLATLGQILGCPSEQIARFGSFTQKNYEAIFADERAMPNDVLNAVKAGMSADPILAASCNP